MSTDAQSWSWKQHNPKLLKKPPQHECRPCNFNAKQQKPHNPKFDCNSFHFIILKGSAQTPTLHEEYDTTWLTLHFPKEKDKENLNKRHYVIWMVREKTKEKNTFILKIGGKIELHHIESSKKECLKPWFRGDFLILCFDPSSSIHH